MSRSCTEAVASDWNVWKRQYDESAGIVNGLTVAVPAATIESGSAVLKAHAGSPLTWLTNCVAACRPRIEYVRSPLYPDFVVYVTEPFVPEPESSVGAWNFPGLTTTGILTTWPWSPVQTMKPFEYAFSAAVVRRNVTVHGVTERGAAVNDVTDGVTDKPGRPVVENVYVSLVEPTLVAERANVCEPARSPIAIDAEFRSEASIAVTAGSLYSFWTLRNASQSFR